jgi:TP901 family phage tail tape measure protein
MHSSATLAVADSFSMVEANKALESTMMQYQMRAYSVAEAQQYSMRIADSWTQVAHNAIVSAQDLAAANERSASAAYQAGVSFDFLQGIIATMSRNTGRAGGELGNSIRAMMVSIHSDKAVKEIEKLGVSMFEVGQNGKKSFRDTEQVLMDLMITADATDKSVEKMLLGISGGKFQYNKISALIGDYSELIRTVELSINSQGAATHQAEMQLDTISRKFQKLKDELAGVAVGAGNGGLTQFLKDILDGLNVIVARIQTIPAGNWKLIGWAIELSVALLAGQAAMKLGTAAMGAYNSVIAAGVASSAAKTAANVTEAASQQMVNIVGADGAVISRVVAGAKAAETVETVKLTMAERARAVATGLATGGLSLLTGFLITGAVGLAMMNTQSEEAAKKTLEHASAEEKLIAQLKDKEATLNGEANLMQSKIKFSEDLASVYPKLLAQVKAEEEAGKDTTKTKERLTVTEHALASMHGEDALARIKASSDTKAAIQKEIDAVKDKRNGVLQAAQETKQEEIEHTKVAIEESQKRLAAVKAEAEGKADAAQKQLAVGDSSKLLKLKAEVELGDPTNDINKNRYGSQVIDTTVWKQSHDKALAEYRNALQAEADTENQKLQKLQENFKKHFSERSAAYVDESALKSAKSEYEYGEKQLALDKILHKNQVEVAKQRFEYAKAYFNQLAEIESRYKDMAEKNGQEYKPSKEFIDAKIKYVEAIHAIIEAEKAELKESNEIAEQKLAYDKVIGADEVVMAQKRLDNMNNYFTKMAQYEAQYKYAILSGGGEYKETKDYSDAKIKRAQAQAALYKAEIDKANALGQLAYNTEKLLKEAEIVEKTGGDSTVKRYQALKEAVKEYLSELEKVQKTKIDLWSSNSKLSIVMDNSSLGDMKEVGKVWIDNKEKVVQSATAIRLNLQSIENEMILEGNNEKYLNALGLKDHLESIQTKLNSDKLGSQQRIELIKQEVQAFAQYENTIRGHD